MNRSAIRTSIAVVLLCTAATSFADDVRLLEETRAVAAAMPPKLLMTLQEEMSKGGTVAAIAACRDKAPQMAREASAKTGWQIRRVSLKPRNPNAVPDAWEQAVLQEFDRRVAAGADATTLEKAEIVSVGDKNIYRYMKALPTNGICLGCHGNDSQIPANVRAKLRELYPDDLATGYTIGQVRGAVTIKRAL